MKYRKKPVVVEAMHYETDNQNDVIDWMIRDFRDAIPLSLFPVKIGIGDTLIIRTLEGDLQAMPGDWIVKGVMGEFYPVRDDIFKLTYEPENAPTHT